MSQKKKSLTKTIRTFTYFIPAPPKRSHGYREKEFDKVLQDILDRGFELLDVKMQSYSGHQHGGVWMVCLLKPLTKKAEKLDINFGDDLGLKGSAPEGVYYDL